MKNQNYKKIEEELRTLLEEHLNKNVSDLDIDVDELLDLLKPYQETPEILKTYSDFLESQINKDPQSSKDNLNKFIELLDNYYTNKLSQADFASGYHNLKEDVAKITDSKLNKLLSKHHWQEPDLDSEDWVKMKEISREKE